MDKILSVPSLPLRSSKRSPSYYLPTHIEFPSGHWKGYVVKHNYVN